MAVFSENTKVSDKFVTKFRVIMTGIAIIYPFYSSAVKSQMPGVWDDIEYRMVVSACLLICVGLTFVHSYFKERVVTLLHIMVHVLTAHLFYVGYRNNLTMFYAWAVTISLYFCIPFLFTHKAKVSYAIFATICAVLVGMNVNGEVPGPIYVLANVTIVGFMVVESYVRERLHKELREREKQLVMASKLTALGEMVGGLAHEINNPLMSIDSTASVAQRILKREPLDKDKIVHSLDSIRLTAQRAGNIIRMVKGLSSDVHAEPITTVDVKQILSSVTELCKERLQDAKVSFSVEGQPVAIDGRETLLSQVFLNLINNAIDAMQGVAASERWIKCKFATEGDFLTIQFVDSGRGIAAEIQDKIMQPFFTTKDVGEGLGLGLSLANKMIHSLHGELFLDKKARQTTFVIRLPKSQAQFEKLAA